MAHRWLAIACFTEDEWRALTAVAGHPEWAHDQRFGDLAARRAHQNVLDALVGGWTQAQEAYQAMYSLQQAGVPAGVCQTAEDRCDHDPQAGDVAPGDQGAGRRGCHLNRTSSADQLDEMAIS